MGTVGIREVVKKGLVKWTLWAVAFGTVPGNIMSCKDCGDPLGFTTQAQNSTIKKERNGAQDFYGYDLRIWGVHKREKTLVSKGIFSAL